mgnify:CR=1 FL=1
MSNFIKEGITRDDFTNNIIKMLDNDKTSVGFVNFLLKQLTQQSGPSLGKNSHLLCHDKDSTLRCPDWQKYREEIANKIVSSLDDNYKYSGKKDKDNLKKIVLLISKKAAQYYKTSGNDAFINTLFQQLNKNQSGVLRSLSTLEYKQIGNYSSYVKEHLIPSTLFVKELINMIKSDNFSNFNNYANQMVQVNLSKEDDQKLKIAGYNTSMPSGWKWGDNPWTRYKNAGINLSTIQNIETGKSVK